MSTVNVRTISHKITISDGAAEVTPFIKGAVIDAHKTVYVVREV